MNTINIEEQSQDFRKKLVEKLCIKGFNTYYITREDILDELNDDESDFWKSYPMISFENLWKEQYLEYGEIKSCFLTHHSYFDTTWFEICNEFNTSSIAIIGIKTYIEDGLKTLKIEALEINTKLRGKGYAKLFFNSIKELAKEMGYKKITLFSMDKDSDKFWEHMKFKDGKHTDYEYRIR